MFKKKQKFEPWPSVQADLIGVKLTSVCAFPQ